MIVSLLRRRYPFDSGERKPLEHARDDEQGEVLRKGPLQAKYSYKLEAVAVRRHIAAFLHTAEDFLSLAVTFLTFLTAYLASTCRTPEGSTA